MPLRAGPSTLIVYREPLSSSEFVNRLTRVSGGSHLPFAVRAKTCFREFITLR
jgi:hypothetical protein